MKPAKKIYLGLSLLLFVTSCAVVNPTADDIFPAMKATAVQFFIVGQFSRWLTLTNSTTPYQVKEFQIKMLTNFTATGTYYTNIVGTNTNLIAEYNTNVITNANIKVQKTGDYAYSAEFLVSLKATQASTTYLGFTNQSMFQQQVSNTKWINVSGEIDYTKDDLSINTVISNYQVYSAGGMLITNYLLNQEAFTNSDNYLRALGSNGEKPIEVNVQKDFTLSYFGSSTNYNNISANQAVGCYVSSGSYNYFFRIQFTGDEDYLVDIQELANNLSMQVNLKNGE